MAAVTAYALCQSACSAGWVSCYAAAGLVAGTVTAGVGAPAAALACNSACGACMSVCASKFLAEGAAETAASGGVMGPVTVVGGAVVAAGGWLGRGLIGRGVGAVAARFAGTGASSAASGTAVTSGTAAVSGTAATGAAAVAATAVPWILGAITIASTAHMAYQGYKWWQTSQDQNHGFPVGIQVLAIAGDHANTIGTVAGFANGDIIVNFGDERNLERERHDNLRVHNAGPQADRPEAVLPHES